MHALDLTTLTSDTSTVFSWLGTFWSRLYADPAFLAHTQGARGMLAAQLYLDVLETTGLLNRNAAPVLHRERWYPLAIRRSREGQGEASALRFGMEPTPKFGRQTDEHFPTGTVFKFGGYTDLKNVTTYPLSGTPTRVLSVIVDNIVDPSVILTANTDFSVTQNSIVFRKEVDPFAGSAFARSTVVEGGVEDEEAILWACDVMFDRDYVYNYLGYVIGLRTQSTDYYKRLVNSIWDVVTDGATRTNFSALLAAVYDVPVATEAGETVQELRTDGTDQLVITDKAVYRFPDTAVFRDCIAAGYVLSRHELMDTSIHVFSNLHDPSPEAMRHVADGETLRTSIPTVTLPPAFFRAPLQHGLTAGWNQVPLYSAGLDANGNPKLWFPLEGATSDVDAYWQDVWSYCETRGLSTLACFQQQTSGIVDFSDGAVCGYVSPLDFLLRNFIGANTILAAVDTSMLAGTGYPVAACAKLLQDLVPAHVYLYIVEHRTTDTEQYSLDTNSSDTNADTYWGLSATSQGRAGNPTSACLTYRDRKPVVRWVAKCG